eukprot:TRINITY_DN1342_c0_g1_i5.p2 TRINITY_DN1342_c0_g1~~TRINITY_DN1342_c0_g1_i5.p2  ORF type:complete len:197 (-),score=19.30 TRINITY_DN1342_c0_g1_i5:172-762(-)
MDIEFSKHVNSNLIIGNFPYLETEIDRMLKSGVKAVLNINNFGEFPCNSINWDIITQKYAGNDIEFIDYLFDESNTRVLEDNVQKAAEVLNDMVAKYDVVFMHGVLGTNLISKIVLEYLCSYKKFSLEAGIKFLHQKQIPILSYLPRHMSFKRRKKQKANSAKFSQQRKHYPRLDQSFKFMKKIMGVSLQRSYYFV